MENNFEAQEGKQAHDKERAQEEMRSQKRTLSQGSTHSSGQDSSVATPPHSALLAELDADRAQLGERIRAPRWLAPAFGGIAALQVASAAIADTTLTSVFGGALTAAGIVFALLYFRSTGVRVSAMAPQGWIFLVAALGITLTLFSVALGLESFGLLWWIVVPALAAFAVVTWLVRLIVRTFAERVLRVR
jgi:hypothetical protein